MAIDKSWITCRRRNSDEFWNGLQAFMEMAKDQADSIAEGYVADEALTFCSMYLEGVQTRFNRPDRNEDVVVPKRRLSVFESQCRPTSKKITISLSDDVQNAIEWFVLDNCSEIDDYKEQFSYEMHGSNVQTEFPCWFKNKICKLRVDGSSQCTEELFALAQGPQWGAFSYTSCIVNGVRFVVQSLDNRRTTQNSGVSAIGPGGFTFYGQLEDIIQICYFTDYSVVLFRCKWFNTDPRKKRCVTKNNITSIDTSFEWYKTEPYILATQAKQVFYIEDPSNKRNWRVVENVNHRKIWDLPKINGISEIDVIHDNNSSNFDLSANLDELADVSLDRVGQSSVVDDIHTSRGVDDSNFINDDLESENDYVESDNEVDIDDVESDKDGVGDYCSSDESD